MSTEITYPDTLRHTQVNSVLPSQCWKHATLNESHDLGFRLSEHVGPVNVVKYNHTHKYCLSGGHDKTIKLWNPATGSLVKTYALHRQEVLGLDM
jgi:WD40 repeat protein